MIRVERRPVPASLQKNGQIWTDELCTERLSYYQELERYEQGIAKEKPKFLDAIKTRYRTKSIKTALKTMFGTKCCYCEGSVKGTSYLRVEHFRPQSIYPSLAYRWTNLLYACEQCNISKSDQFLLALDERQAEANSIAPCESDDTDDVLLIDPCRDDPADFFSYRFTPNEKGNIDVDLVCRNRRAELTRDICKLDRDDLSDARRQQFRHVRKAVNEYRLAKIAGQDISQAREDIRDLISPSSPFSAMACAYLASIPSLDFLLQD